MTRGVEPPGKTHGEVRWGAAVFAGCQMSSTLGPIPNFYLNRPFNYFFMLFFLLKLIL